MRVALTETAEADLVANYTHTHHAERSDSAAGNVLGAIVRAINGLARFSLMGRPGEIPKTRERFVARYPYRIVYHIDEAGQVIEVWRIVHAARQWPPAV